MGTAPVMPALVPMNHRGRLDQLRFSLEEAGIDGLLVTDPVNVRYLTGFAGSAGFAVVGNDSVSLVTDHRYGEVASGVVSHLGSDVDAVVVDRAGECQATVAITTTWTRVGIEADHVTWNAALRYESEWFRSATVVATTGLVAALRLTKDDEEVSRIELGASITDLAVASVRSSLAAEPTERQFQVMLDRAIIDAGADDLSFPTIVASGPNAASPHHVPTDRTIRKGDLVIVDVGALVDGYHSDMTRTFSIGEPSKEAHEMIEVVMAANEAGVASVRPGVNGDDVDRAARDLISRAGLGEEFTHGVGHGVGLLIHEDPFLHQSSVALKQGQVVTVEPGVYRSGVGGVRIEDTLVVTAKGCRPLTHSSKDPVVT